VVVRTGLGQDSHRFLSSDSSKPCVIGGVLIEEVPGLQANSDGDVVYHALCNALSSLTGILVLGGLADDLCLKDGITDSEVYLRRALQTLGNQKITHVAISLEGKRPLFLPYLNKVRSNVARVMELDLTQVGVTATSGEGLTACGCGEGISCMTLITTVADL